MVDVTVTCGENDYVFHWLYASVYMPLISQSLQLYFSFELLLIHTYSVLIACVRAVCCIF